MVSCQDLLDRPRTLPVSTVHPYSLGSTGEEWNVTSRRQASWRHLRLGRESLSGSHRKRSVYRAYRDRQKGQRKALTCLWSWIPLRCQTMSVLYECRGPVDVVLRLQRGSGGLRFQDLSPFPSLHTSESPSDLCRPFWKFPYVGGSSVRTSTL